MKELLKEDLHRVILHIPKDLCDRLQETCLMVGGGFIRDTLCGESPRDIDIFGVSKEALTKEATDFCATRHGRLHHTANAITLISPSRMVVQYITRWLYVSPEDVLASFDFTICQAVVYWNPADKKWVGICGDRFYADLACKRLYYAVPTREEAAGGSLLRAIKFIKRGYNIQPLSLGGVIARLLDKVAIEKLDNNNVDTAKVITGLLREVDPLTVVDGVEFRDEHEEGINI